MNKLMKVSFKLLDLMVIFMMIFGPPMTGFVTPALAAPVLVVDDAGADDEPGQKDLNFLTIDYTPSTPDIAVTWGWDDTKWSGNNTGDACTLFDTNGNGFANYSLCITVDEAGAYLATRLYACTADSRTDRCAGPTLIPALASTGSASIQAVDPFGTTGRTNNDCSSVVDGTCLTEDTVAALTVKLSDFGGSTAKLINVCSYPSQEPNSDPSDCVITPNAGFLTIVKDAGTNTSTDFVFNASENSAGGDNTWTITGSGSVQLISYMATTTLDLTEVIPSGWQLDDAACFIQTATPTPTGTGTSTGVDNLEIRSGLETICTFNDSLMQGTLIVEKTLINDNLGPKNCTDFSYTVDGGTAVSFESDCSNSQTVLAGPHSVVEVGVPIEGYTTTYNNCTNVNVPAGGTATCTITNDDIAVPAMTVDKSSATTSLSAPGTVTYDYLVTNTGNTALTGISLSDDNDNDDMNCPATTLAVGASMTCHATHTFTQAELDAGGTLDNTVTADSNETEPVTDSLSIPISQTASMAVEKSSTTTSLSAPGTVTYDYLVTNTGNLTLTGINLSDNNDNDDMVCASDTLAVGASMTCTATHTFTQAELDAGGTLDNTVTADSNETTPVTDQLSIPIVKNASMTVEKSSITTSLSAPGTVTYDYLVTNTGNVTLTGITLSDDNDNDDMVCESDTLAVGTSMICTATHTFTQAELDTGGTLDNVVTASSNEAPDATDDLSIPITQNASLTVEKSSATTSLSAPGTVTYDYLVTNTGNVTLTGISLSDDNDNNDMVCETDTLAPEGTMTCHATHTFTQAELDAGGNLHNVVTATSNESEPATDYLDIPISKNAAMTVEKSSTTTSLSAPATVTYNYLVTNTGNVTLTGISLSDNNDNDDMVCESDMLAVGASMTCTATHTFTQAELDAGGSLYNVVTASSNEAPDATDDLSIPISQNAAMTVEKSSTTTSLSAPGTVTYDYLVTNTGNVTLTGIVLSDNNDNDDMSCPATTLAVGASMTCHATHTFTQAELDAGGSLYNIVTASSNEAPDATDDLSIPISQSASLTLDKTGTFDAGADGYADVGELISYEFVVTNTGNVTLTGITVTDPKVANISCPFTTLAVGESMTCTGTYAVTQADIDAGYVYNLATADSNETEPETDDHNQPLPQNPNLTIDKTGTFDSGDDGFADSGELISYEFVVVNVGNVTLTGITVTDPLVSPISCPQDTLLVGESMTCTATYAVTQADIDAGYVYNLATADSNETEPETDDHNQPLPQNPNLTIDKTGTFDSGLDGFADPGELISYEFVVVNVGNVTLTGITVTDPKVSPISCPFTTLAVGGSMTCTGTYAVTQADIDAGFVYNLATADSNETEPETDDHNQPLPQNPNLTIDKTGTFDAGEDNYANVGELISYEFVVVNVGNVTLTGITVTDPLVSPISCPQDTLLVGESMTCTATYAVTQADIDAGFVYNLATADSNETEPETDDHNQPLPQNPNLTIDKTGTFDAGEDNYANVGELISYEFVVVNVGNVTLTGITVTDPLVGLSAIVCPADTLAVGASMTCTATYAVTQADIDAGFVYNLATADSNETEPETDDHNQPLPQNPNLTIDKTGTFDSGDDGFADPDELISYEFVVVNVGNVTLTGITVTDPLVSPISCPQDTLLVGESMTCTATYAVTQADIDAGYVYNLATADSNETEPETDDHNQPLPQNPAIEVTKSGTFMDEDGDGYAEVGETISYTFTVKNIGNVTLYNVVVTDPKVTVSGGPLASLAVGAEDTTTFTASYTLTQADIDAGNVENTATACGYDAQDDQACDDGSNDETIPQNPALTLDKTTATTTYDSVGDTIDYSYELTNSGNVTLVAPFTVDDDKATVTCPATPTSLAPTESITCSASYTVTQADIDAGFVTNTAMGHAFFGTTEIDSNEDSVTVNAAQNPAITLTKSANPTLYSNAGDVITYTLVAKNTGNVTLYDVSISDPMLGVLTCNPNQPATLAPNATMTCTGTYTIQAADLNVFSITNTATVNGKGPQDQPVSATATATVYRQTAAMLPTQTTCEQYAAGPSAWPAMYDAFTYQVKSNKISSVAPGVIFYYNTITAPSASFTLSVVETNSLNWKPMLIQDLGQAILYDANCNKASGVTVTTTNNPYTVNFTVTGATPGAIYYIGIKYSPQNLIGQPVQKIGGIYPTSIYSWSTTGFNGSTASIPVKPKK